MGRDVIHSISHMFLILVLGVIFLYYFVLELYHNTALTNDLVEKCGICCRNLSKTTDLFHNFIVVVVLRTTYMTLHWNYEDFDKVKNNVN